MRFKRSGLSIIELIVGLVIIAMAFLGLITVFTAIVPRNIDIEGLTKGTFLAEQRMERLLVKPFQNLTNEAAAAFPSPHANYISQVEVHYVNADDLDSYVAGPTDYKNVKVKVWGDLIDTIEVVTLVTTYELE